MRNQTLSTRLRAVQRRAGLIDGFCAHQYNSLFPENGYGDEARVSGVCQINHRSF
jgi:hypothetical protein